MEPNRIRVLVVDDHAVVRGGLRLFLLAFEDLELVGEAGRPVIHNGAMVGLRCPSQAVVTPATNAVLALEASVPAAPGPCIRCAWCTDHCPARLNVAALNDLYELGRVTSADPLGALSCVECGVCSYVCPARLPLTERVRALKRSIRQRRSGPARSAASGEAHHPPETT